MLVPKIDYKCSDKKEPYVVLPSQAGAARYTQYDWKYTAIEQPLMNNRSIAIPQGKVVGGSTVLNGMAFDRGSASDYDAWAELDNPGWTFKELLPYFKKVRLTRGYSLVC
jgi:choline dehydrogenase-like flavoprotein